MPDPHRTRTVDLCSSELPAGEVHYARRFGHGFGAKRESIVAI